MKGPKPTPEQFGWHNQNGFDDEPSGWIYEEGEERYFSALAAWEEENKTPAARAFTRGQRFTFGDEPGAYTFLAVAVFFGTTVIIYEGNGQRKTRAFELIDLKHA